MRNIKIQFGALATAQELILLMECLLPGAA